MVDDVREQALIALRRIAERDGTALARYTFATLRNLNPAMANESNVQDILGEAFLTATQIIRSRRPQLPATVDDARPWLRRIISFKSMEAMRRNRRNPAPEALNEAFEQLEEESWLDLLEAGERHAAIKQAYAAVTDDERELLGLFYTKELTSTEVAERLEKTPTAVRQAKKRALKKIRRQLEKKSV